MYEQQVILTDLETETWLDSYQLSPQDGITLAGSADWSITKRTLRGGPSAGVDVVALNNGIFSVEVLPTRGMGLWRGAFRGHPIGWQSPVRYPVHPAGVPLNDRNGCGWLDGFNEWVCRCGLESMGAPGEDVRQQADGSTISQRLSLHGRIANIPAHYVAAGVDSTGAGRLSLRGIVDEASLFGTKLRLESTLQTMAGSNTIELVDVITNVGDTACELQLLYHANFGLPLLGEGARILAAIQQIAPSDDYSASKIRGWSHCDGPIAGTAQQCHFTQPIIDDDGNGTIGLCNPAGDQAVRITYGADTLPCLTIWKMFGGKREGYVVGLEPGTSYPNNRMTERKMGRVPQLAAGQEYRTSVKISYLDDAASVAGLVASVEELQSRSATVIHEKQHSEFSRVDN